MNSMFQADWDAPKTIRTLITTRAGGYSQPPYNSFNLAMHVGDEPQSVQKNRDILRQVLPAEPVWLNQIHSNRLVDAGQTTTPVDADGSFTKDKNTVSLVMTADCLPALICNRQGNAVAAVHAGWRGLLEGIVEQGVKQILAVSQCQPQDIMVWLGPAIGADYFEVGEDVRQLFLQRESGSDPIDLCFSPLMIAESGENKYLADIYQLARLRLSAIGVDNVSGGHYCTYSEADKFYSYRRDAVTGRMASMIWIE